jgi:hypothetical protein
MPGDAGFAGQPSIATTSNGTQEFATSDNGPPNPPNYWNPISAAALAAGENATNSDFGYMVLQYNASDAGPGTWTSTEYRADNTVRDICTLFQNGTMSCQSWGIILDDDAGVY